MSFKELIENEPPVENENYRLTAVIEGKDLGDVKNCERIK